MAISIKSRVEKQKIKKIFTGFFQGAGLKKSLSKFFIPLSMVRGSVTPGNA
jgi:hypothetical protein